MKIIGILLIILGIVGIGCGFLAYGDIGIACWIGGLSALLSGIGFMVTAKRINDLEE